MARIQESGELRLAYRTDSRPFSYAETDGTPSGYSVDICRAIAASLARDLKRKIDIKWVEVDSRDRFDAIVQNRADLECGSTTISISRMKIVDFSNIIYADSTGLAVSTNARFNRFTELAGRRIGVISGSTNAKAVAAEAARRKMPMSLIEFVDRDRAFDALARGDLDGFATDKLVLRAMIGARGERLYRLLPDDLSAEPFAIMLPQGDWQLRLAANTAIAELFRSGNVIQLYTRHFANFGVEPSVWMGAVLTFGALAE
jgi:ABC-type amino acid transport substrate-binding protein